VSDESYSFSIGGLYDSPVENPDRPNRMFMRLARSLHNELCDHQERCGWYAEGRENWEGICHIRWYDIAERIYPS